MQKYNDNSKDFYFPSTEEIQQFQTLNFPQSTQQVLSHYNQTAIFNIQNEKFQKPIQRKQNQELAQKFVKFNNLLNTIRQTNQELQKTVDQSNSKVQVQDLILTKLKTNLKDFALTENQLKQLIFLQKKYSQIQKKQLQKDSTLTLKKKNLVQIRKPTRNQQNQQNPRKFKVNW